MNALLNLDFASFKFCILCLNFGIDIVTYMYLQAQCWLC